MIVVAGLWLFTLYGAIARYLMANVTATAWVEITVRLLLAFICFWVASIVLREGQHFKVDLLERRSGRKLGLSLRALSGLVVMVLLVVIAKESLTIFPVQMHQFTPGTIPLPTGLWPLLLFIMAVLMLAYLIVRTIKNLREAFTKR